MTTIAYRNGTMASDSGSWSGDAAHGWARKVVRGRDGTLYGYAGNAAQADEHRRWVEKGQAGDEPKADREGQDGKDSSFIILKVPLNGPVQLVTARGSEQYPDAKYYAIGSGAPAAFGALFMGATAEQAIEAAKEHGYGAFGRVQTVRHKDRMSSSRPKASPPGKRK